jgi:hypothetical protein
MDFAVQVIEDPVVAHGGTRTSFASIPTGMEDVKPPTPLANFTRENDMFKTQKKLKLGGAMVLSPAHVPFMPGSCRQPLTKIEALGKSAQDENISLQIQDMESAL